MPRRARAGEESLDHPKAFVVFGHFQKVVEALVEDLAPLPRGGNPADANTLIGSWEALKIAPDVRISFQSLQNIFRKLGWPFAGMLDRGEADPGHTSRFDEPPHALAIHVRQPAG